MIQIVGLEKSFAGRPVLRGVDLTIKRGETMVIIGRSGCGKSVLLKNLIGLIHPDAGQIYIDGDEVTSFRGRKLMALRKRFGMLFQGAALFDYLSVGDNVGLGLRTHTNLSEDEINRRVSEKLRLVGLKGIEAMKPAELSGGMRKRVGLARAIAMDPEFILFDEPTTGLDPIMADAIDSLISRLQRELTITSIAVTHDMKSAYKIADRIAMLNEGVICFLGTPDEVRNTTDETVQQFIQGQAEGPIKAI